MLSRIARAAQKDCSGGVLKAAEADAQAAFAGLNVVLIRAAYAGLRLGTRLGECVVVLVSSGCGVWRGVRSVARRRAGSSPLFFVFAHSRARFSGQCVQVWPRMVCRSHTTWLGSHVACVAGARFQASSAKLVWDIMACGAAGVSAARRRARGVAGWSAGGECVRGGSRMCVARTEEGFSIFIT